MRLFPPRLAPRPIPTSDVAAGPMLVALLFLVCFATALPRAEGPGSAPSPLPDAPPNSTLFAAHCARCHGRDASARHPPAGLSARPYNFRDCGTASGEPLVEWETAIREGGRAVGRSGDMPSFRGKLTDAEISGLVRYLRGLCTSDGWPNGELNFPRPMVVEKAFPEDEVVIAPAVSHGPGPVRQLRLDTTFEKRLGKSAMFEVAVPAGTTWGQGAARAGAGDLALAFKRVVTADPGGSHIVSAGLELTVPTASSSSALAHEATLFEPFLAAGFRRASSYVQAEVSLEVPSRHPWDERELGYGVYLGRDLSDSPTRWTLGAEVTGENRTISVTPQIRRVLTASGALAAGIGLRVPVNARGEEAVCLLSYLVWDFREPVRRR